MIRTYCLDNEKDWDEGISLLLFAVKESVQEFKSPFELVFGHSVRGPLKLVKENWLSENTESLNLLDYVSRFRDKFKKACELAQTKFEKFQSKMKILYDKKLQNRVFNPGGKASVSSPGQLNKLQARDLGSYLVAKRIETLHRTIKNCDNRHLNQMCEMTMVKLYFERGIT